MHKRLFTVLLSVLAFLVLTGARGAAPLVQLEPISVPEGMTLEEVTSIVKDALAGRGWKLDEKTTAEDGESLDIVTSLHVRVHSVTINISINTERIYMTYVSSANMRYKETKKGPRIHPKYTTWLRNIELDINNGFSRRSFDSDD